MYLHQRSLTQKVALRPVCKEDFKNCSDNHLRHFKCHPHLCTALTSYIHNSPTHWVCNEVISLRRTLKIPPPNHNPESLQICIARRNVLKSTNNAFPGIIKKLKLKNTKLQMWICYTKKRHNISTDFAAYTFIFITTSLEKREQTFATNNIEKVFNSLKDLLNLALCGE